MGKKGRQDEDYVAFDSKQNSGQFNRRTFHVFVFEFATEWKHREILTSKKNMTNDQESIASIKAQNIAKFMIIALKFNANKIFIICSQTVNSVENMDAIN